MAIDYTDSTIFAFPKGQPRVAAKLHKDRADEAAEKKCYAKVDERDGRCCTFPACRRTMRHHHHIVYRSKGGQHDTRTVTSLCVKHHAWVHGGLVQVAGNANKPLKLKWTLTQAGREAKVRIPTQEAA
jgi:hypothetical protein